MQSDDAQSSANGSSTSTPGNDTDPNAIFETQRRRSERSPSAPPPQRTDGENATQQSGPTSNARSTPPPYPRGLGITFNHIEDIQDGTPTRLEEQISTWSNVDYDNGHWIQRLWGRAGVPEGERRMGMVRRERGEFETIHNGIRGTGTTHGDTVIMSQTSALPEPDTEERHNMFLENIIGYVPEQGTIPPALDDPRRDEDTLHLLIAARHADLPKICPEVVAAVSNPPISDEDRKTAASPPFIAVAARWAFDKAVAMTRKSVDVLRKGARVTRRQSKVATAGTKWVKQKFEGMRKTSRSTSGNHQTPDGPGADDPMALVISSTSNIDGHPPEGDPCGEPSSHHSESVRSTSETSSEQRHAEGTGQMKPREDHGHSDESEITLLCERDRLASFAGLNNNNDREYLEQQNGDNAADGPGKSTSSAMNVAQSFQESEDDATPLTCPRAHSSPAGAIESVTSDDIRFRGTGANPRSQCSGVCYSDCWCDACDAFWWDLQFRLTRNWGARIPSQKCRKGKPAVRCDLWEIEDECKNYPDLEKRLKRTKKRAKVQARHLRWIRESPWSEDVIMAY